MFLKSRVQSLLRRTGSMARLLVLTAIVGGAAPAALAQTSFSQLLFDGNVPVSYAQLSPSGSTLRARVEAVPGVALGEGAIASEIGTAAASATHFRTWASGFGYASRVGADARGAGFKTDGGGVSAGIDRFFSPTFLAGVAFTYSHTETTSLGARGEADAISGSVYAAWTPYAGWEAEGLVGIDSAGIDTTRVLAFGGVPVTTRGETDSLGFSAAGTVGYRFRFAAPLGEAFLKPFAGLSYSSQDRDG